jgi:hypothetical protein
MAAALTAVFSMPTPATALPQAILSGLCPSSAKPCPSGFPNGNTFCSGQTMLQKTSLFDINDLYLLEIWQQNI